MGRWKVGPSPKKLHASTSIDMPHGKEQLDVNEFKGSNQITKETKVLPSNDQYTTTIVGNIDKISFFDRQKRDNKGLGTEGQDMFQNVSKARISNVSSPPHPNIRGGNQSIPILSHMIHPSPLHPNIIMQDFHTLKNIQRAHNHYCKFVEVEVD
jgi:hypothetical protein